MRKCNSCNIEFKTKEDFCPLCQNELEGEKEESIFPKNIRYKTNSLVLKIVLFSSIIILLISCFIEFMIIHKINASLYVFFALITNYIIVYFILKNYQNIFKMLGKYGIIIIILLLMWYFVTRSKVITNYIIPSVVIMELIFNLILGIILRKNYIITYTSQIFLNLFLLVLPFILTLFKLTTNNILSYICGLLSLITISGLTIFFKEEIKEELHKIFNI